MPDRSVSLQPRWGRAVAALLGAILLPLNSTMIAVVLPDIARDFQSPPGITTQAIVTSYLVAAVALQPVGGKLGDRFGHWRMFAIGLALFGSGAVLGSLAPSLGVLAFARVLMAAGGAMVIPVTIALIRLEIPGAHRGRAFGAFGAVMSIAAAIGPVVGGELSHAFGWRSVFLVNLPLVAVSVVLLMTSPLPAQAAPHRESPRFAWPGMVLIAATLVTLMLTIQARGAVMAVLAGGFIALSLAFVWWERRSPDPIFDVELFKVRSFKAGTLLIALLNLVMYTLLFELPQVLEKLMALNEAGIGRLLIVMMVTMVVTSVVAGQLADTFGSRLLAMTGSLCCLVGVALLAGAVTTPQQVLLPLVLVGAGLGLATPAAQSASLKEIRREQSGTAAGMNSTMRYLGGIVGIALLGRLLNLNGDRAEIVSDHRLMLLVFAGALIAGLICAALLPGRDRQAVEVTEKPAGKPNSQVQPEPETT